MISVSNPALPNARPIQPARGLAPELVEAGDACRQGVVPTWADVPDVEGGKAISQPFAALPIQEDEPRAALRQPPAAFVQPAIVSGPSRAPARAG